MRWYLGCLRPSRPPESTLESVWALVLPRTRTALVVCALELRISTETFGEGSGPTQASALGWAPRGRAGRSKSTLYLGAGGPERHRDTGETGRQTR